MKETINNIYCDILMDKLFDSNDDDYSYLYSMLAKEILRKLKNHEIKNPNYILLLDSYPIIDFLRTEVSANKDAKTIEELLNGNDEEIIIGLGIVRPLLSVEKFKKRFMALMEDMWINRELSFGVKVLLIYRFLDFQEYNKYHLDYLNYIIDNFDTFSDDIPRQVAPDGKNIKDNLLKTIGARLNDNNFPGQKKWIYFLFLIDYLTIEELKPYLTILEDLSIDEQLLNRIRTFIESRKAKA